MPAIPKGSNGEELSDFINLHSRILCNPVVLNASTPTTLHADSASHDEANPGNFTPSTNHNMRFTQDGWFFARAWPLPMIPCGSKTIEFPFAMELPCA